MVTIHTSLLILSFCIRFTLRVCTLRPTDRDIYLLKALCLQIPT
ncbi:BgTH12-05441 [Blumeria graminis f. sp. triticale]|uniref:Bgt-50669 n=2 Tax=Blumeria graminis TaxID=34373 RepID=A0A9X9QD38_BLUGR|nr:BgTH12-05441 [Blumeria graminis f. sp. triticale]VDB88373.1 Bgt-50669 [Blumeria graminis f. sp. tritici]